MDNHTPPPPYSAHADSSSSSSNLDTEEPILHATQEDVNSTQRAIQQLQGDLQHAFNTGDTAASASIAQTITRYTQQLKTQQSLVEQSARLSSAEKVWVDQQLAKVNAIKNVIEGKRRDVMQIQETLRQLFYNPRPSHTGHKDSATSSLFSSLLSSHSSSSSPSAPPLTCASYLVKARKSVKETQMILEKQIEIVDTIDMNGHPSTLLAASTASPSPSLSSIKAVRKETVTCIQRQQQYVDELDRHLGELDAFLTFLDTAPRPSYGGEDEKRPGGGAGRGEASGRRGKGGRR